MKQLKEITQYQGLKLSQINYKQIRGSLSGIQLAFQSGVWSPMFGTMEAFNKEQVTAKVDSTKKVE